MIIVDIEKDKRNEDKANQLLDNVERIIGIRPVPISQDGFHSGVRIQIGDYIWKKDLYFIQNLFSNRDGHCPYWDMEIRMLNFYYLKKYGKSYTDKWVESVHIPMGPGSSVSIGENIPV